MSSSVTMGIRIHLKKKIPLRYTQIKHVKSQMKNEAGTDAMSYVNFITLIGTSVKSHTKRTTDPRGR
jgi:hypothetical protein